MSAKSGQTRLDLPSIPPPDLDAPEDEWRLYIAEETIREVQKYMAILEKRERDERNIPLDS